MKKPQTDRFVRHQEYIDRRLQVIKDSSVIISRPVIGSLVEFVYGNIDNFPSENSEIACALDELRELFSRWDILTDGDLGGYILQSLDTRSEKKHRGQFFTPPDIVRQMLRSISFPHKPLEEITFFDPACGSGQFILHAFEIIRDRYISTGLDIDDASRLTVRNNLYGNDIDPVAAQIARLNLSAISGIEISGTHITDYNYLFKDELGTGHGLKLSRTYDVIIGNPPWGSTLSPAEKNYIRHAYTSASSGINTFTAFIERSLDFLPEHGQLSFLIPEAYLNIRAHQRSRQLVLENVRICSISCWGEQFPGVFAPSISLYIQKDPNKKNREQNIIEIFGAEKPGSRSSTLIPQDSYTRNVENIFNIRYNRKASDILSIIAGGDNAYLKNRSTFFLGVVTGNNREHILPFPSEEMQDPIIIGRDVRPYRIDFSNHFFHLESERLQQVAPRHLYRTRDKLLYRFIGRKLVFALDREGYCMVNNVNGIIPSIDHLSVETILSILNSRLMQYYYDTTFFTVKVLRGNLERLPLRRMSMDSQRRIAKAICHLVEKEDTERCIERENLEDIIFHEYGLSDSQAYFVSEFCSGRTSCPSDETEKTAYISITSSLPSSNSARPLS